MNFISAFSELDKLYESVDTPIKKNLKESFEKITRYSKADAEKLIASDTSLTKDYEELLPYYEEGTLDHSFIHGNFFNLIEDETKVVIQWYDSSEIANEVIADSLEEAIVIIADIEKANGDLSGEETYKESLKESEEPEEVEAKETTEDGIVDNSETESEQEEAINKQIILECVKCGALVIKDESEVTIDEESDLANVGEECAYCEESEGFKAIGTFEPYVVETVEDEATEEEAEAEVIEEDDVVEEALKEDITEDEELEEGIFDKKKNSAEMNNARRDFSAEVKAITGGDSLADMAHELTSKLRDSINAYKYYEEKKANHTTDQISLQRVYKSKAEQVLKLYAELIKTLKKPTNFYAPYSVISSAIRKVLGGYSSDSDILSRIRDYGEKLNKIGAIKADKKVKAIELADFYKKVVNGLDGDYRLLQKKPTHTLFN